VIQGSYECPEGKINKREMLVLVLGFSNKKDDGFFIYLKTQFCSMRYDPS